MDDRLDYYCQQLRQLIIDLEVALPYKEWVQTGFMLTDVMAFMHELEAERSFWAEPDYEDEE